MSGREVALHPMHGFNRVEREILENAELRETERAQDYWAHYRAVEARCIGERREWMREKRKEFFKWVNESVAEENTTPPVGYYREKAFEKIRALRG